MLNLPNGPWNLILSGNWGGIDISYYENPDKEVLVVIFDKKGEKIAGIVMLLSRFFIPSGNATSVVDAMQGNAVYIKKKTNTKKLDYVAVVTDPLYSNFKPAEITMNFNKLWNSLQENAAKMRESARKANVVLTELKNANQEQIHAVFGEPLALPTVIMRKPGEGTSLEIKTGMANLGIKQTGEKAEETVQNFILSILTGKTIGRMLQVIIEEGVLNGITVVLFDENNSFENINKPNSDMKDFEKFGLFQPMGMPVRTIEPGIEAFIEIPFFSSEFLSTLLGSGKDTIPVLDEAMKSNPDNLKDLEDSIESKELKKYVDARMLRVLKLVEREHGDLFKGKNDAREILAPWLKKMGRVSYVKLGNLPDALKAGIVYSVVKSIHRFMRSEAPRKELQSMSVLEYKTGNKLFSETEKTLKVLLGYGHGSLFYARDDLDFDEEIKENARIKIHTLDKDSAVVKVPGKKEYRLSIRPTLSYPTSLVLQS